MGCAKAKEFLLQYRRQLQRIRQIEYEIELLYANADIGASKIRTDGIVAPSRISDPTGELASKIAGITERLRAEKNRSADVLDAVAAVINDVPDQTCSRLLFDRYVICMSWERTALDIGYDPSHTRGRLHSAALLMVQKELDGVVSEDDKEWDAFLDRLVAVREGKAPKYDGEWIPCEYRQPPKPGTYLTTTKKGAVRMNHWYGRSWGYSGDAIAWRPMPEAWRGR